MKTRITFVGLSALILSSCSTGFFATSGYDDIYYSPKDEPVVVVEKKSNVADNGRYEAIENYEPKNAGNRDMVLDEDTLYYENYGESAPDQYVENNYDNDYYYPYSSRIYRFHRPYVEFGYYNSFYDPWYDPFYFDFWPMSYNSFYYPSFWSPYYYSPYYYSPYYMYDYYSPYSYFYSPYYNGYYGYGSPYYAHRGFHSDPVEGKRRGMITNREVGGARPGGSAADVPATRRTSATTITKDLNTSTEARRVMNEGTRSPESMTRTTSTPANGRVQTRAVPTNRSANTNNTQAANPGNRYTRTTTSGSQVSQARSGNNSEGSRSYAPRYSQPGNYTKPSYNRSSGSYSNPGNRSVYSRPSSSSSHGVSRPSTPSRSTYSSPSSGRSSSAPSRSSYSGGSSSSGRSTSSGSSHSSSSGSGHRR